MRGLTYDYVTLLKKECKSVQIMFKSEWYTSTWFEKVYKRPQWNGQIDGKTISEFSMYYRLAIHGNCDSV